MVSISVKSRLNPDGTLSLNVPTGLPETDVEVLVVVQPLGGAEREPGTEEDGWPAGFIAQTFGCLEADPLARRPEADYEVRERLL